jgi:DNA replication protein DnaC
MKLDEMLSELRLDWMRENHRQLADAAARENRPHAEYLEKLLEGECERRHGRHVERRIRNARFPYVKGLDQFNWSWPKKINRIQVQNLFRLAFLEDQTNVIFVGGVGLGKTHLATALGYEACQKGHSVLFAAAVDIVNTLLAAQTAQRLKPELKRFTAPDLLIVDELGYLPIDKHGADLLFQVISARYERGSMVITTNRPFKQWPSIFNNDATLTSAVLDRILHHNDTVVIEGPSYRMREKQND